MSLDEALKRFEALSRELSSAVEIEREAAARSAREAAEASAAASLAEAEASAEQRGFTAGREEGLVAGRRQGFNQGHQEGYDAGRKDGYDAGRKDGFEAGTQEGYEEGQAKGFDSGRAEGYRAGQEEGHAAAKQEVGATSDAADLATAERLADAMRAIDRARSLTEILDTLASCAGRETPRAAVLLVRGERLRGWRFIGFGPALDEGNGFEMPLTDGGIIAEAVRSERSIATDSSKTAGTAPKFAESPHGVELLAAPIAVGGQVVAVLYTDRGSADPPADRPPRFAWRPTLEMMASHAARTLEAVTAFRTAQSVTGRVN